MILSECATGYDRRILHRNCTLPDLRPQIRPLPEVAASPSRSLALPGIREKARSELKEFGLKATAHPLYKHVQGHACHKALLRAVASGDLNVLRSTLLASRVALGLDDAEVKRVGFLLSEADHCVREIRKLLTERNLEAMLTVMTKISTVLSRTEWSGLGSRLWEDPTLSFARQKRDVWTKQSPFVAEMLEHSRNGCQSYATEWSAFALGDDQFGLKSTFGIVFTNELLRLPEAGVRSQLVDALCDENDDEPVVMADACPAMTLKRQRLCYLLSSLDDKQIDSLVLCQGSDGKSAMEAAAASSDLSVFCAFYIAVTGEVLEITPELEVRLVRQSKADPQLPLLQRVAIALANLLQMKLEELCIWRLRTGGLKVKLLVDAGQPSGLKAQEILGGSQKGAVFEPCRRNAEAMRAFSRWVDAGLEAQQMFDNQVERMTLEPIRDDEHKSMEQEQSNFDVSQGVTDDIHAEMSEKAGILQAAEEDAAIKWSLYMEAREACTEAIVEHGDDEMLIQQTERKSEAADAASKAAKQLVRERTELLAEATARHEDSKKTSDEIKARLDEAAGRHTVAANNVRAAEARYEALRLKLLDAGVAIQHRPWKYVAASASEEEYWWRRRPTGEADVIRRDPHGS